MNKILYAFLLVLAAGLFLPSCEDDFNLAPEVPDLFSTEGAAVSFTSPNPSFFDNSAPDEPVTLEASILGEPVTSVRLLKSFNGGAAIEHTTLNSFPTTINISLNEALTGTGLTVDDMKVGDTFTFSWETTTASGTYRNGRTFSISVSCSNQLPGTYDFVSTDHFCGDGPIEGTVDINAVDGKSGAYTFSDWSFGVYTECYGTTYGWGTLEWVRFTAGNCDECSQTPSCNMPTVVGEDEFGDTWTYTIEGIDGADLTISWENTYGEFGKVVLSRTDGSSWPPLQ